MDEYGELIDGIDTADIDWRGTAQEMQVVINRLKRDHRAEVAALKADNERLRRQRDVFLDACDEALLVDPAGGRGMTARAARLYFDGDR